MHTYAKQRQETSLQSIDLPSFSSFHLASLVRCTIVVSSLILKNEMLILPKVNVSRNGRSLDETVVRALG